MSKVRTRFAPSPTGDLHLGGARTALFSWLYARHHQGIFILRIEDTDLERSSEKSVQTILDGLAWLGLNYDEGPYYQTQRFERYHAVIQQLLDTGHAYKCYCSKERLEKLRENQLQQKLKPRYDGHCYLHPSLPEARKNEPYVIRFLNPREGVVTFEDGVRGHIQVQNSELDDLIIARSNGAPTYNLTVVVDDWDMEITHVIRGEDHINNTPRQINIFKALQVEPPKYSHVPMILGRDGKKLSKRHGAASVTEFKEQGILPQALMNYLVRLGWAFGDQEIFSEQEMIRAFQFSGISRSPAAFDPDKLLWLNQQYMKTLPVTAVAPALQEQFNQLGLVCDELTVEKLIPIQAERTKTLKEMAEKSRYFFEATIEYDAEAVAKHLRPEIVPALKLLEQAFAEIEWEKQEIHSTIVKTAEAAEVKLGKLAQPLRIAVTGNTISPPIDETLYLLGKEKTLARLAHAITLAK